MRLMVIGRPDGRHQGEARDDEGQLLYVTAPYDLRATASETLAAWARRQRPQSRNHCISDGQFTSLAPGVICARDTGVVYFHGDRIERALARRGVLDARGIVAELMREAQDAQLFEALG